MKLFVNNATAELAYYSLPFDCFELTKATARLIITIDGKETIVDMIPSAWAMNRPHADLVNGTINFRGASK
jgi:hypothetical protein